MLVSVIIPAYNSSNSILKTLQSLKEQTYKNIEIIVVLDGCTDDTLECCQKYQLQDNRIKIIEQENSGPYSARYNGISQANGKYVMFVDADDYLDSESVELLVDISNKTKSDVIRFRYEKILNGNTQYVQDEYFKNEMEVTIDKKDFKEKVYPFFLDGYMLNSIWANFIKKEAIPENNVKKRIGFGEDLLFNLNCFSNINRITFINKPLYKYCTSEGSITRTLNESKLLNNLSDALYVYLELYNYAKNWYGESEVIDKLEIRIVYELSTIVAKLNQSKQNFRLEIDKILNNKQYTKMKRNIDKSKIDPNIKNYDIILDLIGNELYNIFQNRD